MIDTPYFPLGARLNSVSLKCQAWGDSDVTRRRNQKTDHRIMRQQSRIFDAQIRIITAYGTPLYVFFKSGGPTLIILDLAARLWNLSVIKANGEGPIYRRLHDAIFDHMRGPPFGLGPDAAMNLIQFMENRWQDEFRKHKWLMPNLLEFEQDNAAEDRTCAEPESGNASSPAADSGSACDQESSEAP